MGNKTGSLGGDRPVDAIRRGDFVAFVFDDELLHGTVEAVDSNGGGLCYGVEPSCDVLAVEGRLYKHVPQRAIRQRCM